MTEYRRQKTEDRKKTHGAQRCGMTLMEIIVSLAIMAIIFAVIVPQFVMMRNSWSSKAAVTETLQNGRILIDHLERNLSKAVRITAVSDSTETNGYIQFLDNDDSNLRYEIAGGYSRFGTVGSLYTLTGSVSQLRFSCYDACNLDTPLSSPIDANSIRLVEAETTLTSTTGLTKTLTTSAYLRTNSSSTWELNKGTNCEFDAVKGIEVALAQIDETHYLCVYSGTGSDGYAVVLTVDTQTLEITAGTPHQYTTSSASDARYPAVAQIDSSNYLCVYRGQNSIQSAIVLTVDTGTCTVTERASTRTTTHDSVNTKYNSIVKVNDCNYLCVYTDNTSGPGHAAAFRVDTSSWTITPGTPYIYTINIVDNGKGITPQLARINDGNCLCVYYASQSGYKGDWAVVLRFDTNDANGWTIAKGPAFNYDTSGGSSPAITQIDDTHYLTAYSQSTGYAVVLTVNTGDWTISPGTSFQFESVSASAPALAKIDSTHYLCAYRGHVNPGAANGWAVILTVNTSDWTVSKEQASLEWESVNATEPVLVKVNENVNDSLFLCAYEGGYSYGWSVMLEATKIQP